VDRAPGYDPAAYGDDVADIYDRMYRPNTAAVRCLAGLAGAGPVLELAIGTGRLALPLAATGLEVHGIDASAAMVAQLRAKPGGDAVPVVIGDIADVGIEGEFALVFVAFNTFFVLLTAAEQRRCFANVARHLSPGGRFVIEAFVPDPSRFVRDQHVEIGSFGSAGMRVSVSRHDARLQRTSSLVMRVSEEGARAWPVHIRYSYPAELDTMAADVGLLLEHRWSSWEREPFEPDSATHVSVYVPVARKPSSTADHRAGSR
jgi:SAM-dependent methyltransferase